MTQTKPVALVTGASSGIGRDAAMALTAAGFQVAGTSRKASGLTERDGFTLLALDVADDASVAAAVEQVIERFGRIDVLVNNAGVGTTGAAEERSIAEDQAVFDINVFGVMRMTKAVLPHMRAQRSGRIINVSSALGFAPAPYQAIYAASKHAVEGYTESLDHEIRGFGIRALLIEPALTNTAFESNTLPPAISLAPYVEQRTAHDELLAAGLASGDDPSIVAATIVAAATDRKPKLRYTAGPMARRMSRLRRFAPASAFDQGIRKFNGLPA
jgi:NAD(P)-dependent dehydrogenase (short-subunit alcohol dehydrogenase family)